MKKWTPEQIEKLKLFWRSMKETTNRYYENLWAIEQTMASSMDIPELEFFRADGSIVGIGNKYAEDGDRYVLLQGEELE